LESQLKETTMANTALQKELDEFNRQCKENEYIKSEKESGIADMKKRIADFKKWVSELSENSKKLIDEHNNMNATFQTFMNIWSAVDSQQFLQTTLLGDNPLSDVKDFKGVAYRIDDLQKDIQNRFDVQEGLSRYLKELQRVIEESQNLTK
jgi:predicted nuclease with TOPRIM domain